ncbi:MAG TPA: nitrate- and nitrite sensing domain-containing protein [Pseudonocardiaceae bacterium]|nr:nitrate- and nitrite sensing domain-containing protein [Pseudonocardiaceae bacterium]
MSSPTQRMPDNAASPLSGRRRSDRFRSVRAGIGRWHDLRLPVKLSVVMAVPMVVLVTLGVVLISDQLGNADAYSRASRITELSASVRSSITALQNEREQVTIQGTRAAIHAAGATVDTALAATRGAIAGDTGSGDLDPVAVAAWSAADRQLGELGFLRAETAAPSPDRSATVGGYSQLVDSLFAFDRVLTTGLADAQLSRQALALYDLFAAREEIRYQQSVVLAGIARHTMSVDDVTSLHGSAARLDSRISDFRAVASQDVVADYAHVVGGTVLARQSALLGTAIDQSGGMTGQVMAGSMIDIPATTWNAANLAVTAGLSAVTDRLASALSDGADALRTQASDAAGTAIAVLIVALAATIALVVLVARQLVRSIGLLRRTARDVASRQLPAAVERIMAGETVDVSVAPVGVHTSDEVGQLARAFDAVHGEALRLAVEQASLRANYSELFVNLSRRSQSLVQRQLRLIEQLERDEEDPDQLSALFKLDHLATRMRRNNENLMVLSGSDLARGPGQAVALADLLRAGVSEIEQYQRVVVQPPPDAHVVGYAAGDLVRLLAELLDNATAFSAPETPVTVASHRTRRRAIVIDIVDHGIGMSDEDLVRANEQLSRPAGVEGRVSRRMGLFVISRLANQHGIRVRLHGGQDIPGLRVTITVPVELVIGDIEPPPPAPPPPSSPNGQLPKRVAGSNALAANGSCVTMAGGAPTETMAPADLVAEAVTVTIPAATSSGVGLFAPIPADDEEPATGGGEAAQPDGTPIYDTMVSAWFDDTTTDERPTETADSWRFAADQGWQAVDAVACAEQVAVTTAGLPRRQPKARLLPGSVSDAPTDPPTRMPAEHVRDRLTGYQQGIQRGRHNAEPAESTESDTFGALTEPASVAPPAFGGLPTRTPAEPTSRQPLAESVSVSEPHAAVPEQPQFGALPKRVPASVEPAGLQPPAEPPMAAEPVIETPVAVTETVDASTWASSADDGWRAVDAVTGAPQIEFTAAGLPKRQPNAQLLPGSVAPKANGSPVHPAPDAGAMRDRLSSFQRGVRQGRDFTAPVAATPVEHGFHW